MKTKVLQVFYNENGLPFKDQERTVHFPVVGSGFMGASNTTQIKFYFKEIGDDAVKYVAVSKLPNGKVGSKVLENYYDSELDEPYALLELDSYYTQYKGDLFISLQGYQGGVQVTYDEDTELYEIEGTPTIQATGSIKFTNNYAAQFVGSGEEQNITLQQLLAIISDTVLRYYFTSSNTLAEVFNEIGTKICAIDIEGDEYLCEMSGNTNIVLYDIHNQEWYAFTGANTTTIDNVLQDSNKQIIATKEDLENFGNLFTYKGTASVSEINALTDIGNGWAYNLTDSGTLTLGNLQVETGDNVAFNGTTWTKLSSETVLGNYYTKQEGQEFETQVDNRVDAIENQVQQVSQGSPKGVYATLAALQAAYPTGTTGIYVVQADGHWYYWNGSAWTSGGTYQSTGIAFGSIDIPQLNNEIAKNFESANMFDKSTIVSGGYFANDGTISSSDTSYYSTQYIPVKYGKTYVLSHYSGLNYVYATYDKDGNYLARGFSGNAQTLTFNSNVAFVRLSTYNFAFNANFMFCEQDKVLSEYQDYNVQLNVDGLGVRISDEALDDESENPLQNKVITNTLFNTENNILVTELNGISDLVTGYGTNYGNNTIIVFANEYQSYYVYAQKDLEIWVEDNIAAGHYYSICVGTNPTGETETANELKFGTNGYARYRNNDNNLPTEDNKLSVAKGSVIVFTFTGNHIYHICGIDKHYILKQPEVESDYKYKKTTNQLEIETKKAKYIFKLVNNQSIRINTWRLYSGYLKKPDGTLFEMWDNSDAEGVVALMGEGDFIGGYHGNETMTSLKIFADGIDITNETDKSGNFDNLSIFEESDVYHTQQSATPNDIAFKRSKQIIFYKDKVEISNNWIAQAQLSVNSAPLSMFQCYWKENDVEIAECYSVKPYYKLYTMEQATESVYPADSVDMTEFYLETKLATIKVKVNGCNGTSKEGHIAYDFVESTNRIKYYYFNIKQAYTTLNQGDNLYNQFEFEIK